jgi:hypothetical protein
LVTIWVPLSDKKVAETSRLVRDGTYRLLFWEFFIVGVKAWHPVPTVGVLCTVVELRDWRFFLPIRKEEIHMTY